MNQKTYSLECTFDPAEFRPTSCFDALYSPNTSQKVLGRLPTLVLSSLPGSAGADGDGDGGTHGGDEPAPRQGAGACFRVNGAALFFESEESILFTTPHAEMIKVQLVERGYVPSVVMAQTGVNEAICYYQFTYAVHHLGAFPAFSYCYSHLPQNPMQGNLFELETAGSVGLRRFMEPPCAVGVTFMRVHGVSIFEWMDVRREDFLEFQRERKVLEETTDVTMWIKRSGGGLLFCFGTPAEVRTANCIVRGLLFQLVLGLYQSHRTFGFCHNDLHTKNVCFRDLNDPDCGVFVDRYVSTSFGEFLIPREHCPGIAIIDFQYASYEVMPGSRTDAAGSGGAAPKAKARATWVSGHPDGYTIGDDGSYDLYRFCSTFATLSSLRSSGAWENLDADIRGFLMRAGKIEPRLDEQTKRIFRHRDDSFEKNPCVYDAMSLREALDHPVFDAFRVRLAGRKRMRQQSGSSHAGAKRYVERLDALHPDYFWQRRLRLQSSEALSRTSRAAALGTHADLILTMHARAVPIPACITSPWSMAKVHEAARALLPFVHEYIRAKKATLSMDAPDVFAYHYVMTWGEAHRLQTATRMLLSFVTRAAEATGDLSILGDARRLEVLAHIMMAAAGNRWMEYGWNTHVRKKRMPVLGHPPGCSGSAQAQFVPVFESHKHNKGLFPDSVDEFKRDSGEAHGLLSFLLDSHERWVTLPIHSINPSPPPPADLEARSRAMAALIECLNSSASLALYTVQ